MPCWSMAAGAMRRRRRGRSAAALLWDKHRRTVVNNDVYLAGFAATQAAYEPALAG